MNIILGKNSGFCAGVKHTITKAEEALERSHKLDCLGEIIHNKEVVSDLAKKGLRTIQSIEEANDKVIIRAHGVSKEVYSYANEHNIELIDLTCPKVLKIHEQVQKFALNNYFICLLGVKNHAETIGTYSYCGDNSCLIEDYSDIEPAIAQIKASRLKDVLIISQTTFSVALFEEFTAVICETLGKDFNIQVEKSICNATSLRQAEASEIAAKADVMIIIGGKNSSNTKKLYEVSQKNCDNVIFVQTKDDLDTEFLKNFNTVRNNCWCFYS